MSRCCWALSALFLATLRGMGIDWLPILVGNVVLHLSSAMTWTSMRVFTGRKPHWPLIGVGRGALGTAVPGSAVL